MRYLIYLILAISTSLNAGSIHKWTDEKGNVHYGDVAPVKTRSEDVRVLSAPSNPGKALPRLNSTDDSAQAENGNVGNGNAAGNDQEVSDEQASNICASARADLDIINNSIRIKLQEPDGNIRYLNESEIAARKADSQTEVDRFCK
jgi:hypothetical protein